MNNSRESLRKQTRRLNTKRTRKINFYSFCSHCKTRVFQSMRSMNKMVLRTFQHLDSRKSWAKIQTKRRIRAVWCSAFIQMTAMNLFKPIQTWLKEKQLKINLKLSLLLTLITFLNMKVPQMKKIMGNLIKLSNQQPMSKVWSILKTFT